MATERLAEMFPTLDAAHIDRLRAVGHERAIHAGEILFDQGEASPKFLVVLEGAIEVVHPYAGGEHLITVHEPGEFTGEISMIAGLRSLVRGRALSAGLVLELDPAALRTIVAADADLGEIFMRAFILRRTGLIQRGHGDVVLLGSRHSAGTLRVQEFLTRNYHPYTTIDVDTDPAAQALLDQFGVGIADVPVVICRGQRVLKNPSNAEVAECLGYTAVLDAAKVHDVVVIGAGPAGLAAAVYGSSEGLDVLVLESTAPGRPGWLELQDRELPRLPYRHLGPGARCARGHPGRAVRQRHRDRAYRDAPGLRPPALPHRDRRHRLRPHAHGRGRHRRALPQAGARVARAVREPRRVLQRNRDRGQAVS